MHGLSVCCDTGACKVSSEWERWIWKLKACETIDGLGMWLMLRVYIYEVGDNLLKACLSFYVDIRVCVSVGIDVSEWFTVNARSSRCCLLLHGYLM